MGFLFGNARNESGSLSKITLELNLISLSSIFTRLWTVHVNVVTFSQPLTSVQEVPTHTVRFRHRNRDP